MYQVEQCSSNKPTNIYQVEQCSSNKPTNIYKETVGNYFWVTLYSKDHLTFSKNVWKSKKADSDSGSNATVSKT